MPLPVLCELLTKVSSMYMEPESGESISWNFPLWMAVESEVPGYVFYMVRRDVLDKLRIMSVEDISKQVPKSQLLWVPSSPNRNVTLEGDIFFLKVVRTDDAGMGYGPITRRFRVLTSLPLAEMYEPRNQEKFHAWLKNAKPFY